MNKRQTDVTSSILIWKTPFSIGIYLPWLVDYAAYGTSFGAIFIFVLDFNSRRHQ